MRSFAVVLALVAIALIGAALLAYPVWLLVGLISDQPIHRVMHRIAMLVSALGFIWWFRRQAMFNRYGLGIAAPREALWREAVAGLLAGTLLILPLVGALHALGVRVPRSSLDLSFIPVAKLILFGLSTGLVVALIEEMFFRGILFSAIRRESGIVAAVVLPSLLYASLHFLSGRLYLPADQLQWNSGLTVLSTMFAKYAHPAAIADSFSALFAVGVLLALVRVRTRGVAACIGLHAAWVCVISYVKDTTLLGTGHSASWLVGDYDGVLGWGALAWMALMAGTYLLISRDTLMSSSENLSSAEQRA